MRKLKVALTTIGLMALIACGSDKKNARTDVPKDDPNGISNTNAGSQNAEELPAPPSSAVTNYTSQDRLYTAVLQRDGERYSISISNTYMQNLVLSTNDKRTYRVAMPGVKTPILDELTLTVNDGQCQIVWKENGYDTYDRIFQGPCP